MVCEREREEGMAKKSFARPPFLPAFLPLFSLFLFPLPSFFRFFAHSQGEGRLFCVSKVEESRKLFSLSLSSADKGRERGKSFPSPLSEKRRPLLLLLLGGIFCKSLLLLLPPVCVVLLLLPLPLFRPEKESNHLLLSLSFSFFLAASWGVLDSMASAASPRHTTRLPMATKCQPLVSARGSRHPTK